MRLTIPVGSAQGALDRGIAQLGNFSTEKFLGSGVPGHPRVVRIQGWFLAGPNKARNLRLLRTPKIPGKEQKKTFKSMELLERHRKKARKSKRAKEDQERVGTQTRVTRLEKHIQCHESMVLKSPYTPNLGVRFTEPIFGRGGEYSKVTCFTACF